MGNATFDEVITELTFIKLKDPSNNALRKEIIEALTIELDNGEIEVVD